MSTRGGTGASSSATSVKATMKRSTTNLAAPEDATTGGATAKVRTTTSRHDCFAYQPATDPIFKYGRSDGVSVTGGFVYRGARLGAAYRGRYFFADYSGHLWSLALTIDGNSEARASDRREHTAELGGNAMLGQISSFGVDADGGLLRCQSFGPGRIVRITAPLAIPPTPTGLKIIKP